MGPRSADRGIASLQPFPAAASVASMGPRSADRGINVMLLGNDFSQNGFNGAGNRCTVDYAFPPLHFVLKDLGPPPRAPPHSNPNSHPPTIPPPATPPHPVLLHDRERPPPHHPRPAARTRLPRREHRVF